MTTGRYRRLLGRRPAQEVDDELRLNFELRVEEYLARGMSLEEAQRAAKARMGDVGAVRDEVIEIDTRQKRNETLTILWQTLSEDIRIASRMFAREKLWTVLAVWTLALGIGANSALFSIVNAIVLRQPPFAEPERIISITTATAGVDAQRTLQPIYEAWHARSREFSALAASRSSSTVLRGAGDPEVVAGRSVTPDYFLVLGVQPLLGRHLATHVDPSDNGRVVVLSEQVWRRLYGADPSIVGRTILMDQNAARVIGVMPASFTTRAGAQYWERYAAPPRAFTFHVSVVGKLAPHATIESARVELQALLPPASVSDLVMTPVLKTLRERLSGDVRPALLMLFAAVGVVLLIACANVANLLLARATRRQREFAVRAAIGASSWRLTRFIMAESTLLGLMGAVLGLAVAKLMLRVFLHLAPPAIAGAEGVAIDSTVVVFTLATMLTTALIFGLAPALQVRRLDVNALLTNAAGMSGGPRRAWLRRGLVVGQLATALMLITVAGLLTKSFAKVTTLDTGFEPERVVVIHMNLSPVRYAEQSTVTAYFDRLGPAVSAIPGVEGVGFTNVAPLGNAAMSIELTGMDGRPTIDLTNVSPNYFRVTGMRLVAGRAFNATDIDGAERVAILNETAARVFGRNGGVIGKQLPFGDMSGAMVRVVGVARDVLQHGVENEAPAIVYKPIAQYEGPDLDSEVIVRTAGDPSPIIPAIRAIMRSIDASEPIPKIETLEDKRYQSIAPRRFSSALVGAFAAIGALLAAIGLYGVMSYLVIERTNEIGIRAALGADSERIMRFVLGEGMILVTAGVTLGLLGSLAGVRLLQGMLFRVNTYDPLIFIAAAGLLVITALIACAAPARRAASLDPVEAIRSSS